MFARVCLRRFCNEVRAVRMIRTRNTTVTEGILHSEEATLLKPATMEVHEGESLIQHKLPDVPLVCERNFAQQFLETLWANARNNPKRLAVINAHDRSDCVSYSELYNGSMSIAAFLEDRGLRKGDVCCLVLPSSWEFIAAFGGVSIIGGVVSGCSTAFKPFEISRQINDSGSKVVFCGEKKLDEVITAIQTCPRVQLVIVVGNSNTKATSFGFIDFKTVLETPPCIRNGPSMIEPANDLLMLPYSSGTTGNPKGCMITHQNFGTMMNSFIWYNQNNVYRYALPDFDPKSEHHLLILPYYHIYGLGIVVSALMEGYTVVALQQFQLDLYCQCIQDFKIRQLYFVPPIAIALAKSPIVDKYDLSSLNNVCGGAAPLGFEVCSELKKRLKLKYVGQGYGLTEISMAGYLPNTNVEQFDACGYLTPTLEAKIVDITNGKTLPPNKRGEVCFRGPTVFKGYLNRPRSTADTIVDGWLHTGDIGYIDDRGQLYLVDRIKELIKVKGFQVPPAELEDVLLSHPLIDDCAVIGIPDEKNGEVPKAFVVRRGDQLTEQEVRSYVAEKVAQYKQLTGGVEFMSVIPKTPSGKILRRELRKREQESRAHL